MEPMPPCPSQAIKPPTSTSAHRAHEGSSPLVSKGPAGAAMSKNDIHGQLARANVLEQLTRDTHMAIDVMNYHSDLTFRFVEEGIYEEKRKKEKKEH